MKKRIVKLTIVLLLITNIAMIAFDYNRVKNNEFPMFTIKLTKNNSPRQYWVGPFYYSSRTVKNKAEEKLSESYDLKFGLWFFGRDIKFNYSSLNQKLKFVPVSIFKCQKDKEFYFSYGDIDYYRVCIDHLSVSRKDKTKYFDQAVTKDNLELQEVLDQALNSQEQNGRFTVYSYSNFNLVKCSKVYYDNKEIGEVVLTTKDIDPNTVCSGKACSFTKTFKIIHKNGDNHITIKQGTKGLAITVALDKKHYDLVEDNKVYDFVFTNPKSKNIDNNNIEEIFEFLDIVNIKENTSNVYINENLCM